MRGTSASSALAIGRISNRHNEYRVLNNRICQKLYTHPVYGPSEVGRLINQEDGLDLTTPTLPCEPGNFPARSTGTEYIEAPKVRNCIHL